MVKWKVRSCPRCSGDMFIDKDLDFWYQQCLQCSYRVELKPLGVKEPAMAGDAQPKKPVKPVTANETKQNKREEIAKW